MILTYVWVILAPSFLKFVSNLDHVKIPSITIEMSAFKIYSLIAKKDSASYMLLSAVLPLIGVLQKGTL